MQLFTPHPRLYPSEVPLQGCHLCAKTLLSPAEAFLEVTTQTSTFPCWSVIVVVVFLVFLVLALAAAT